MSINLNKNLDKILEAHKDVLNDKTETDWALFGYEGQTNDLKVIGTGDGGLEELADELNTSKIMYAFVRVHDSKTSLSKCVLINWQGEGAPVLRKGTCANHIREVATLLKGAHLTVNARVEDEVEKDRILAKVSATGSAYSFKENRFTEEVQKGPVGTAYSRVNPAKEINTSERDSFWRKEEEEEKKRVEIERERKKLELAKADEERRFREQKEYLERERRIAEDKNNETITLNIAAANAAKSPVTPLSPTIQQSEPLSPRAMTQAELMRQQRNQEAKELIGSRVGTAKAIFSQNSASGQMQSKAAPAKPVRNSIAQRINTFTQSASPSPPPIEKPLRAIQKIIKEDDEKVVEVVETVKTEITEHQNGDGLSKEKNIPLTDTVIDAVENTHQVSSKQNGARKLDLEPVAAAMAFPDEDHSANDEVNDQYSTIKRSPHLKNQESISSPVVEENHNCKIENLENTTTTAAADKIIGGENDNELIPGDGVLFSDMLGDAGMIRCRALYDYQAADESEITFDPGDLITHIDQIDEGWWQGLAPDGSYGLFPANYVELIKN